VLSHTHTRTHPHTHLANRKRLVGRWKQTRTTNLVNVVTLAVEKRTRCAHFLAQQISSFNLR